MADVKVKTRFIRVSPRKIRSIIDLVRGMKVDSALDQLNFIGKKAAIPVIKTLKSGIAAAKEKNLDSNSLWIKEVFCDSGPFLKRQILLSRGRASPIKKRMSHLTVVLSEQPKVKNPNEGSKDGS